jgi:branched-chain amino acid transport system permease protein
MTQMVQVFILGMSLGGVYALMAAGLTIVFGVMRIVNIAHAAFMFIAAYITYFLFKSFGIDPILSIVVTMPAMYLLGVIVYRLVFARVADNSRFTELTVLLTFSLALVIEGLLGALFTNIYRSTNPRYATDAILFGNFYLPEGQFYATLISLALLGGLWLFLRTTRTGYAIRAAMQNRTAAQVVGVDVNHISMIAFGLGMAMAGASGSLSSFLFTFFPGKHWEWVAILLSLIVLGGMGSLLGSLVGAFALAVSAAYVSFFYGPTWSPITFFLALFLILMFRPRGLFGKPMET